MQYFHIKALNYGYKFLFKKLAYSLLAHKSPNTKILLQKPPIFFTTMFFFFRRKMPNFFNKTTRIRWDQFLEPTKVTLEMIN
jgi:hypothetical protein